ncbi:hypothetical protein ACVW00_000467 [Marmoricola sp. URHA0025 HA25]
MSLDTFEQSLLTELREHVSARKPDAAASRNLRRRWTVGLLAGGLTTAAAAFVAVGLGAGIAGPSAAYAVDAQPDGDVVVTVYDLSDASGLEHALAAEGVRADISHVEGFTQADGQSRSTAGTGSSDCTVALAKVDGGLRFTLSGPQIASGAELDIVTSGSDTADVGSPVAVTWSGGSC